MDLISVIVPIYKVEDYIDKCVNSIISQTYTSLEIILVDDGSPDKCPELCEAWAKKDERIKVIHKKNGGLSSARNAGLEVAQGEYIVFIDSDDWIKTDYVEKLYSAVKESGAEVAECEIIKTYGEENNEREEVFSSNVYDPKTALGLLIDDSVFHQYVWNKLYKRDVIGDIIFAEGKLNEDEFFTYQIFGRCNKIVKISNRLYYYLQRPGSIMGESYNIRRLDALEAKTIRQAYIEEKFPQLSAKAKVNLYNSCIYSGQMTLKYLKGEDKIKAKKRIKEIVRSFTPTKNDMQSIGSSAKLWINLSKISFFGLCNLKNVLKKGI